MASLSQRRSGAWIVQFTLDCSGPRITLQLGKIAASAAKLAHLHIGELVEAARHRTHPSIETRAWTERIDRNMHARLGQLGLVQACEARTPGDRPLGEWIDDYIGRRADVKLSTRLVYLQTRRVLIEYFGADRGLGTITAGDAEEWRLWLAAQVRRRRSPQPLAENTVRRRSGIAKQFMAAAVRKGFITANPFADLVGAVKPVRERFYFVSRADAANVLEACPDENWRAVFALARFGGLRCPSEVLGLRWEHVRWDVQRITVPSPKTARYEGGEARVIPLFPELALHLRASFESAVPGSVHVIRRDRLAASNLRTHFKRIITRAGVTPWPKLFHNLRATRETELAEQYPMHVVCRWIGNSQPVAVRHYLGVTEEHYARAVRGDADALQNALQLIEAMRAPGGNVCMQLDGDPRFEVIMQALRSLASDCS